VYSRYGLVVKALGRLEPWQVEVLQMCKRLPTILAGALIASVVWGSFVNAAVSPGRDPHTGQRGSDYSWTDFFGNDGSVIDTARGSRGPASGRSDVGPASVGKGRAGGYCCGGGEEEREQQRSNYRW
jgi:hypothetical protein